MRTLNRLGIGQRVVIVIGLGVALFFVGEYVTSLGTYSGWVGSAPLTTSGQSIVPLHTFGGTPHWFQLIEWLVLVVIWTFFSILVMRASRTPRNELDDADSQI